MMTCSRNLSKHLKHCYQTKTNKEMSKHDFQFFANLMNFLIKKSLNFFFLYLFFTIVQNFKPKRREKTHNDMCI
jgi:flagellar biosynthesis protein FlhB